MSLLKRLFEALLELLYPSRANCMGCGDPLGADEDWLCDSCRDKLVPVRDQFFERCPRCGCPVSAGERCATCGDWPDGLISVARYVYPYHGPIRRMIWQMKYRGVFRLAEWMGRRICQMLSSDGFDGFDLIVPVPLHKRRERTRGFNQSELLAREVSKALDRPVALALARVKNTRSQAGLSGSARRDALRDAFEARMRVEGACVLLIDDVLTTGTTALRCAQALKQAGAAEVMLAAVAGAGDEFLKVN